MKNIVSVFRPWLDAHPEVDVYYTEQTGWVCYSCFDGDPITRTHMDRQQFLILLAAWFFDETEDMTWAGAAEQATKDILPYLAQLPPEDTDIALSVISLFLHFDEERFSPHDAP